jgi:hypothetical protein
VVGGGGGGGGKIKFIFFNFFKQPELKKFDNLGKKM